MAVSPPATSATSADDDPVEDRRERVDQAQRALEPRTERAARRRRLDLGRLVERGQRVHGRRPGAVQRGGRLDDAVGAGGASIVRRRRAR